MHRHEGLQGIEQNLVPGILLAESEEIGADWYHGGNRRDNAVGCRQALLR